jgi:nitroimidazol reductase NimA-like FMN-containing flavoprotein (pyridoxamine 5'-phosphate oxidase superfamily)
VPEQKDQPRQSEPKASRPFMPGYGILDVESGKGLLPWAWATERLLKAHTFWLATSRADQRPHLMPIWGVWISERFLFSTGKQSRKARNLAANSHCVVSTENAGDAIIIEGKAEEVTDQGLLRAFAAGYSQKYQWNMEGFAEPVYVVYPTVVFGLTSNSGEFTETATRWKFEGRTQS